MPATENAATLLRDAAALKIVLLSLVRESHSDSSAHVADHYRVTAIGEAQAFHTRPIVAIDY